MMRTCLKKGKRKDETRYSHRYLGGAESYKNETLRTCPKDSFGETSLSWRQAWVHDDPDSPLFLSTFKVKNL